MSFSGRSAEDRIYQILRSGGWFTPVQRPGESGFLKLILDLLEADEQHERSRGFWVRCWSRRSRAPMESDPGEENPDKMWGEILLWTNNRNEWDVTEATDLSGESCHRFSSLQLGSGSKNRATVYRMNCIGLFFGIFFSPLFFLTIYE